MCLDDEIFWKQIVCDIFMNTFNFEEKTNIIESQIKNLEIEKNQDHFELIYLSLKNLNINISEVNII